MIQELFDAIKAGLLGPTPTTSFYYQRILYGSKHTQNISGSPLIILVPDGAEQFGTSINPGAGDNPQTLASKQPTFTAHCWGLDYLHAERLADAVHTACYDLTSGNVWITGESWIESGWSVQGVMLVRSFRVSDIGIPRITLPLTNPIVEAVDQTWIVKAPLTSVVGDDPAELTLEAPLVEPP